MRLRDLMTEKVLTIGPEAPEGHTGLAAVKAKAQTAATAMTAPAVTVAPYESVAEAARLMCERRVNRLPVVKDDKLIGIVTRADLVRAFRRGDEEIEREIEDDVLGRTLWIERGTVTVAVTRGTVQLEGVLHARSDAQFLGRLVGRVPGVVAVRSNVTWQVDDRSRKGRRALEEAAR